MDEEWRWLNETLYEYSNPAIGGTKDVNYWELFDELVIICNIIEEDTTSLKVFKTIFSYSLQYDSIIYCNMFNSIKNIVSCIYLCS